MQTIKRILVATDFGETSARAVAQAIELTNRLGAELVLVHCFEIPSYAYAGMAGAPVDLLSPIRETAETQLRDALGAVRERVPGATAVLRLGIAAEEILAAAREAHADLIVMGTHGRRGVAHLVLGSVAERVVRTSPVPVLTVRGTHAR